MRSWVDSTLVPASGVRLWRVGWNTIWTVGWIKWVLVILYELIQTLQSISQGQRGVRIFACIRWSFGWCYIDSFVCMLEAWTKHQWGSNAGNNKSWPKSLIVSNCNRIQYYKSDPPKIGRAPNTNVISNTYLMVSINTYWELTHWANPNIHHTPR